MKTLFSVLLLASLASCKTLMVKHLFRDPVVENTASIKAFQTDNGFSTENSLILTADSANAGTQLLRGLTSGYYIFDKNGNHLTYNGQATCGGLQFNQLAEGNADSFEIAKTDTITLNSVLAETYNLQDQAVTVGDFAPANYYIVAYWQKFIGGKKGYDEAVGWMESKLKEEAEEGQFTFIKVNTDLQESWGMVYGKKAKIHTQINGRNLSVRISDFPMKK